ncbi:autotransporter domain-containing protein [Niveibacterium umoris]|uniref:Outer membrane lipase/esterase n=1 Tax=Niveibacterium umoris TaxID=1193620 RepID=A0A840BRE4_9RHOO|nr:autotransporter domain-containing protein [Niveibacterium umoris]MBB4013366.1 outer membrane lipase/esterase [Niveibacterium umoris]
MFIRRPLGLAVAALLSFPAAASDFNATVFFGDSLTDSGFFGSKWTTNPGNVWAENLAGQLGTSAVTAKPGTTGTDYAQGGARVTTPAGQESMVQQLDRYLGDHGGKADSRTLYTVWGGNNDIFYAVTTFGTDANSITNYVLSTTTEQTAMIKKLLNAGAKYVLVPNLPDIGATPLGASVGPTNAALLTSLSDNYNKVLFGRIAAAGLNVIPLDTFNLLREVRAHGASFGLTNTTDRACGAVSSSSCFPANYVTPNADKTYAFADDVHPTTAAHVILADYAYSMLMAPQQIGMLAETPVRTRSTLTNLLLDQGMESPTRPSRVWATLTGGQVKYGDDQALGGADGLPYGFTAGYDTRTRLGGMGVAFNFNTYKPDFAQNGGSYTQNEVSASFYGGVILGQLGLSFAGTVGYIGYNTSRDVKLGPVTRTVDGETEGSNISAGMQAFYQLQSGKLTHGPVAGLTAQRVQVRAFNESNANGASTALSFGSQVRQSVLGHLAYQMTYDAGGFIPYGRLGVEHDFIDSSDRDIQVGLPSVYTGSYALPAAKIDQTAASVQLGSRFLLNPALGAWVEFDGNFGRKDISDYTLSAGLRYAF